jgi:hypothetical protein
METSGVMLPIQYGMLAAMSGAFQSTISYRVWEYSNGGETVEQYSTVQYSTVQYSTVQYSMVWIEPFIQNLQQQQQRSVSKMSLLGTPSST